MVICDNNFIRLFFIIVSCKSNVKHNDFSFIEKLIFKVFFHKIC